MEFSKILENLVSPKFDENILIGIIKDIFKLKEVFIQHIEFKPEQKKGDSYLSTVSAFTVQARGKDVREDNIKEIVFPLISKVLPKNIGWRNTFRLLDFFQNEVIFYNVVWKAMNKFQLSKHCEPVFDQIPLCISAFSDGSNDYVLLEDMTYKGYIRLTRSDGLDFEHSRIILRSFAKVHALGLAFKDQKPEEFETIANSLQASDVWWLRDWYCNFQNNNLLPVAYDAVAKQLPDIYLERLKNCTCNDFYGKLVDYTAVKGRLAVVTHGDAWAPNFLFKYDENDILQDAVMIDFQMSRYASLALDLTFFLYSCTEESLRIKFWDTLIEDYHKTFISTLEKLGSSPELLTLDDLRSEIKTCALFGVGMSLEAVPMAMLEDGEVANLNDISDTEHVSLEKVLIVRPFKSEKKRQRIADIIKHAVDNDFI
ncbi:hypothetical protein FQR65_LT13235 [Abscondita terminalis]|nr:hypothetical protein FQR65_LT13235 [Abscondita terminalis]